MAGDSEKAYSLKEVEKTEIPQNTEVAKDIEEPKKPRLADIESLVKDYHLLKKLLLSPPFGEVVVSLRFALLNGNVPPKKLSALERALRNIVNEAPRNTESDGEIEEPKKPRLSDIEPLVVRYSLLKKLMSTPPFGEVVVSLRFALLEGTVPPKKLRTLERALANIIKVPAAPVVSQAEAVKDAVMATGAIDCGGDGKQETLDRNTST